MILALIIAPVASAQSVNKIKKMMEKINANLEAMGEDFRLEVVDFLTYKDEAGQTVYYNNRTKQLGHHWVPGDPRRGGGTNITWLSDQVDGAATAVSQAGTQAAMARAMETWDDVNCSSIPLVQLPDFGIDWGYVQWIVGGGGIPGWYADITHAGWFSFFTVFGAGWGNVLGVTFTYVWVSGGEYTDIDNNKKLDVAFREIYYNNDFTWGINTDSPIDVETVVLHETGHGLSQGHFGRIFRTEANGMLHFAPRAVMNAAYSGIQQELTGTDNGGHCSIWAHWPNR
ncbi:MAG: hypothetical protein GTO17_07040 [Candidatus Aminicenantes bacterium]|nr:hypothetical protein [Candidatus Aminicenantes bacterium]